MCGTIPFSINKFKEKVTNLFTNNSIFLWYMAYASNFIKRCRIIKPDKLITMLAIASFRSKPSSLVEMVSIYKSLDQGNSPKPQSLQERINSSNCVEFVKMALQSLLKVKILNDFQQAECELLQMFNRVLIEDSSSFELSEQLSETFKGYGGNSSQSSIKMNIIYDLKSGRFVDFGEHSGVISDQTLGTKTVDLIEKGDVILRDLGYLNVKNLIKIENREAFFLSRLSGSLSIYETKNGEAIPFSKLFEKHSYNGLLNPNVYIGRERFPVRLIAYRVPEEVANNRRRILNRNGKCKGRKVTVENASRQNFSIYLTNVPKEVWPIEIIQTIYRLRWQIELIFRSWKSQLKINILLGTNKNRIRLLLYAKWLAIIICTVVHELVIWFAEKKFNREASFHKIVNFFLLQNRFEKLLKNPQKMIKQLLYELGDGWLKDRGKKKISTMRMVKSKMPSYI